MLNSVVTKNVAISINLIRILFFIYYHRTKNTVKAVNRLPIDSVRDAIVLIVLDFTY